MLSVLAIYPEQKTNCIPVQLYLLTTPTEYHHRQLHSHCYTEDPRIPESSPPAAAPTSG